MATKKAPPPHIQPSLRMEDLPELLSTEHIRNLLGIGNTSLWRLERDDPSFPSAFSFLGRAKRWQKKAVAQWLDDKHAEANAKVA